MVDLAEDVTPEVQVGQQATASTVIATMYNGGAGIETGWAMADEARPSHNYLRQAASVAAAHSLVWSA